MEVRLAIPTDRPAHNGSFRACFAYFVAGLFLLFLSLFFSPGTTRSVLFGISLLTMALSYLSATTAFAHSGNVYGQILAALACPFLLSHFFFVGGAGQTTITILMNQGASGYALTGLAAISGGILAAFSPFRHFVHVCVAVAILCLLAGLILHLEIFHETMRHYDMSLETDRLEAALHQRLYLQATFAGYLPVAVIYFFRRR